MKNQNLFSFLGGLTVGAIAALLLAPDSGKNTRHKIGDKIKHGEKKIKDAKNRVEQKIQNAKLAAINAIEEPQE